MPITLQRFANGDTTYVTKHNNNADVLEGAVVALESRISAAGGAALSVGEALRGMLGDSSGVIGATSYRCTGASTTLTVQAGYAWLPTSGIVTRLIGTTTIPFVGLTAGTYYITPAPTGTPQALTSSTDALYSVVWTGSAFGTITRLAAIVWGAADWIAAQTSTAYSATYETLDARLEATEVQVGSAGLSRTNQTGRLLKTLAGVNVTLTDVEANNSVIEFTGTITADITVTVPATGPRAWIAVNNTTGNFRVTFKVGAGAGTILPTLGAAVVYHTTTNAVTALRDTGVLTLPSSTTLTADFARADTVRCTLAANSSITLAGAVDGQKCTLEVLQDGTGGWSLTFGSEVRFGTDLPVIAPSSVAGKMSRFGFIYNATAGKYDAVSQARGF